jgi:hypothetical protein
MSQTAFSAISKDKDNALTREEFLDYCDRTPEVRAWLSHFDDAADLCDDIKYQMDSDVDHEFDYFPAYAQAQPAFSSLLSAEKDLAESKDGARTYQAENVSFLVPSVPSAAAVRILLCCLINNLISFLFARSPSSPYRLLATMPAQPPTPALWISLLIQRQYVRGTVFWNTRSPRIHLPLTAAFQTRVHSSLSGSTDILHRARGTQSNTRCLVTLSFQRHASVLSCRPSGTSRSLLWHTRQPLAVLQCIQLAKFVRPVMRLDHGPSSVCGTLARVRCSVSCLDFIKRV